MTSVYGVKDCDEHGSKLVKKVVHLSVGAVVILTFSFVWNNSIGAASGAQTNMAFGSAGFVLSLTVPACGYLGAKNRNKVGGGTS